MLRVALSTQSSPLCLTVWISQSLYGLKRIFEDRLAVWNERATSFSEHSNYYFLVWGWICANDLSLSLGRRVTEPSSLRRGGWDAQETFTIEL